MILGLREQNVDVIAHRIDLNQRRLVVFQNTSDVSVKFPALLIAQQLATPLRAEHEMHDDVRERL